MSGTADPKRSTLPPRRRRLPPVRREVLTAKSFTIVAVLTVTLTALCVYVFGKRSFWVETEWVLSIVAVALFAFLATGLYRGIRVRKKDAPKLETTRFEMSDVAANFPDSGIGDMSCPIDAVDGEGCFAGIVGAILAVLVGIVLVFVLAGLIWVFANVALVLMAVGLFALAWVFHRALRQVFVRSKQCRGNMALSLKWAGTYTILYLGWLYGLVLAARYFLGEKLG